MNEEKMTPEQRARFDEKPAHEMSKLRLEMARNRMKKLERRAKRWAKN